MILLPQAGCVQGQIMFQKSLTWTFEQDDEDGYILPKKVSRLHSFKEKKTVWLKRTDVESNCWMTRMISLPSDLDTRICYQFKNPLDKDFVRHSGISRQIMGIHFIVDWQQIF